ncbi:MAG: rod shape-determining protein [Firmicutes bacterium]|nr:rod shape-determining protein [Bacillota bacterium]
MDYAIYIGDLQTVVYKRDFGVVMNEATCVAYAKGADDAVAMGSLAKRMLDQVGREVIVSLPVRGGRIVDLHGASVFFREILKKVESAKKPSVLVLIPCSLSKQEFNHWKKMVYSCNVADAEFVPLVVASAYELGFNLDGLEAGLSVHIGDTGTDIAVVSLGGIIRGGTIAEGQVECINRLKSYVLSKFNIRISEQMAKQILQAVGTLKFGDEVSFLMSGSDATTGGMRESLITGIDCYEVLEPIYSRIIKAIQQVLIDCPPNVITEICSGNVYFGGVGCDITHLREFLARGLELDVKVNGTSIESAINGAGKMLASSDLIKRIVEAN